MKLAFESLTLDGTSRTIGFTAGLNIILGPISTGKTSVLRLCRILLGSSIPDLPPEVLLVPGILGHQIVGRSSVSVYRTLSKSPTAPVDVSTPEAILRLPVTYGNHYGQAQTYGRWLLGNLGLPALELPSAPTKPDSDPTLVSINDYLNYCDLPKEEIRSQVFGHRMPFKDIKRRYVFEILYGQYSAHVVKLQDELRGVRRDLNSCELDVSALQRLLSGTPWESRAALEHELDEARKEQARLELQTKEEAAAVPPSVRTLQQAVIGLDVELARGRENLDREREAIRSLDGLTTQLRSQIGKLTRAIVAGEFLGAIDFVVCPRCGADVDAHRVRGTECYLCLQPPKQSYARADLIAEEARVGQQLSETQGLIEQRSLRLKNAEIATSKLKDQREDTSRELNFAMQAYVSDSAEVIQRVASERSRVRETIARLEDYLRLYQKISLSQVQLEALRRRAEDLTNAIEAEMVRREDVEERIEVLEAEMTGVLRQLRLPGFLGDEIVGTIDRLTYLPRLNGRSFDSLISDGLSVELNVAHAVAHQRTALKLGLALPNLLLVDGLSGAFGVQGFDPQRIGALYDCLAQLSEEFPSEIQVVAADNRVPDSMRSYVRLELSENDRLIPLEDLGRLRIASQGDSTKDTRDI